MTTLVLMRHGVAEDDNPGGEAARRLTPEGLERAGLAAQGLVALGMRPDLVLTSPLVRCRQTAELVAGAARCPLEDDPRLAPGMSASDLIEVIIENPEALTLLACTHQPGLTYALADLTGCGQIGFKRPGAAVVELQAPRLGAGRLVAVLPPRVLRAAAEPHSQSAP